MKPKSLRFRQVHLDFHTSPDIERIGAAFDKKEWQETLLRARVDSITCFSKCHHGLSYHETGVGRMHPHLDFDLLRAQIDACREIGVKVPVYLSAGLDNTASASHPEWREIDGQGHVGSPLAAYFHKLCFQSPYLDYLCRQIEETVTLFPEADGIFLDIICQGQCCCNWCLAGMEKQGLDAEKEEDRRRFSESTLELYYRRTTAAAKSGDPDMPIFHNSGHIVRGRRDILGYDSHLELESLPTGGWGYDHFPESASYAGRLGLDYLGMTGKFHASWGEFGGFKHPNALRYECAAMIAFGAKCSVGDQLHPEGRLDLSTYDLIGAAYEEVAAKEPWCRDSAVVADVGVLSSESENPETAKKSASDTGACRILLEAHYLFELIDRGADFNAYRLLILPDDILIDEALRKKIDAFLGAGGKLLLTGRSGLKKEGAGFAFPVGAEHEGSSPFSPDYILPLPAFRPDFIRSPLVMYVRSERIKAAAGGQSLGQIFDPYFNRTFRHFCSHQHAPNRPEPSGYDCGVRYGNTAYLAHPVFALYRHSGAVAYKEYVLRVLAALLAEDRTAEVGLSSTGRITLRRQAKEKRQVLHLLHAAKQTRGGGRVQGGAVEVIEELEPVRDVALAVRCRGEVARVTLEPQGRVIPHRVREGRVEVKIDSFTGHQMVVFQEA